MSTRAAGRSNTIKITAALTGWSWSGSQSSSIMTEVASEIKDGAILHFKRGGTGLIAATKGDNNVDIPDMYPLVFSKGKEEPAHKRCGVNREYYTV